MRILTLQTLSEVTPGNAKPTPERSPPPRRCDDSVSPSYFDIEDTVVPKVLPARGAETLVPSGKSANYRSNPSVCDRTPPIRSPVKNTFIVEVPGTFNVKLRVS